MTTRTALSAVDVFAGGGGLSLGIKRAGFKVKAALELNPSAAAIYKANHRGTDLLIQDVATVTGKDLVGEGTPDLLVGCAPCEGFCSLTSKLRREDPRNRLLLEMGRLVAELQPHAVMMENVPGLLARGSAVFEAFVQQLVSNGYLPTWRVVQMADFGVPQRRRRLVLLAGRGFGIPHPEPTHSRRPIPGRKPWVTIRQALGERARKTIRFSVALKRGGPQAHNWDVVRTLKPQTLARLKAARPGGSWREVDEQTRPECHQGDYCGFTNVYGRMAWDEPAPTITGGCTTPAKGRFGHPDRRRTTISVREASILQTFPESYSFTVSTIDAVCEVIGNAVPPLFAEAAGREIRKALSAHRALVGRRQQ